MISAAAGFCASSAIKSRNGEDDQTALSPLTVMAGNLFRFHCSWTIRNAARCGHFRSLCAIQIVHCGNIQQLDGRRS